MSDLPAPQSPDHVLIVGSNYPAQDGSRYCEEAQRHVEQAAAFSSAHGEVQSAHGAARERLEGAAGTAFDARAREHMSSLDGHAEAHARTAAALGAMGANTTRAKASIHAALAAYDTSWDAARGQAQANGWNQRQLAVYREQLIDGAKQEVDDIKKQHDSTHEEHVNSLRALEGKPGGPTGSARDPEGPKSRELPDAKPQTGDEAGKALATSTSATGRGGSDMGKALGGLGGGGALGAKSPLSQLPQLPQIPSLPQLGQSTPGADMVKAIADAARGRSGSDSGKLVTEGALAELARGQSENQGGDEAEGKEKGEDEKRADDKDLHDQAKKDGKEKGEEGRPVAHSQEQRAGITAAGQTAGTPLPGAATTPAASAGGVAGTAVSASGGAFTGTELSSDENLRSVPSAPTEARPLPDQGTPPAPPDSGRHSFSSLASPFRFQGPVQPSTSNPAPSAARPTSEQAEAKAATGSDGHFAAALWRTRAAWGSPAAGVGSRGMEDHAALGEVDAADRAVARRALTALATACARGGSLAGCAVAVLRKDDRTETVFATSDGLSFLPASVSVPRGLTGIAEFGVDEAFRASWSGVARPGAKLSAWLERSPWAGSRAQLVTQMAGDAGVLVGTAGPVPTQEPSTPMANGPGREDLGSVIDSLAVAWGASGGDALDTLVDLWAARSLHVPHPEYPRLLAAAVLAQAREALASGQRRRAESLLRELPQVSAAGRLG